MDHRAHIKIDFSVYGQTYTADFSINWNPDDNGVDQRVSRWFREHFEEAETAFVSNQKIRSDKQRERDDRMRAEALGKLTAEERRLLNL